jgi:hypothetical protein
MKRLVRFVWKRYWPALVVAALLFGALGWLIGPRPAVVRYLATPEVAGWPDRVLLSPSGRYLLVGEFDGCTLFDLESGQPVFSGGLPNHCACGFTPDEALVFYYPSSPVKFYAWRPGQAAPQAVGSSESFPTGLPDTITIVYGQFSGMTPLFQQGIVNCLLSPDARWWLLCVREGNRVFFGLVDSVSGRIVSKLEIPAIELSAKCPTFLTAAFTADSTSVVTNLGEQMRWFEVPSGRLQRSGTSFPVNTSTGEVLGTVGLVTKERIVAVAETGEEKKDQSTRLMIQDASGSWRSQPMPETKWTDPKEPTILELTTVAEQPAGVLIYCWRHSGAGRGRVSYYPGYSWAARDLATGELLHVEKITDENVDYDRVSHGGMVAVLPGGVAVLEKPLRFSEEEERPGKPTWWDRCRELAYECLPQLRPTMRTDLLFLDGRTGRRIMTLPVKLGRVTCLLSSDKKSLHVVGVQGTRLTDRIYDYPLRKPWWLIVGWSAVVALGIALILETSRLTKRAFARMRRTTTPAE